jgi:hypothetical protein
VRRNFGGLPKLTDNNSAMSERRGLAAVRNV